MTTKLEDKGIANSKNSQNSEEPELIEQIIDAAYQFHVYIIIIKPKLSKKTPDSFETTVLSIVNTYLKPVKSLSVTTRHIKKAQSIELLNYPHRWPVDKSKFLSDIKRFVIVTTQYRVTSSYITFKAQFEEIFSGKIFSSSSSENENIVIVTPASSISASYDPFALESRETSASLPLFEENFASKKATRYRYSSDLFNPRLLFKSSSADIIIESESSLINLPSTFTKDSVLPQQPLLPQSFVTHSDMAGQAGQNSGSSNQGFSRRQLAELSELIKATNADIIASTVRNQLKANRNLNPTPNPNPNPNPNNSATQGSNNSQNGPLKATDIGFFDPDFENKDTPASALINAGRHVFYKDIYAFIDRIKDMAAVYGTDKIRETISTCFRGETLIWHSMKLSDVEKDILRTATIEQ